MDAPIDEAVSHPVTLWVGVGVAALVAAALGLRRVAQTLAPGWEWWRRREVRELLRQAEIEAAAKLLNDSRVTTLLERVEGLTTEIAAQREELIAARDEERRRADALEEKLGEVSRTLTLAVAKLDELGVAL